MKLPIRIRRTRGGEYLAECEDLPGCVGRGRNVAEARRRFTDAARGYLASVGNFVPERLDAHPAG
ncbi:MAG: type II toxin-antitoxin system HicB family antitoxin [Planctomycetota bacterium]